jgi:nucleotide-binding universal stress UspA family protein
MMKDVKNILVPIDFSENSEKIVQHAALFAKKFEARLTILFVAQSFFETNSDFFVPHVPIAELEQDIFESSKERMALFMAESVDKEVKADSEVLLGDVAQEILDYAQDKRIDMIVMGTHGYQGLDKLLFGSVAEKVVKMSPCPVLTVNPYR